MKYLIISTYDSSYDWYVKTNDGICTQYDYVRGNRIKGLEKLLEEIDSDNINYDTIKELDYDFIVIYQDVDIMLFERKE